jgi:N-formylmaleamate deformylase
MNRRLFLLSTLAFGLVAASPAFAQARFEPTRFSVEVRGRGPDVILIPGLTSGRDVWRATANALPGYRYHLIQVSGFAGEPARGNRDGAIIVPLADEIARYIAERRLERPAIVGHSMGGTLAMMIASRRPGLAGRIMVVDMLPQPAALIGADTAALGPWAETLRNLTSSRGGRQLFANLMGAFAPPAPADRRSDPDVVARAMQDLARIDMTPQLSRIRAPFTIVYAAADPRARPAIDRSFASAYAPARGARLVRVDGSGHMVMLDQPARFRAALQDFLRR